MLIQCITFQSNSPHVLLQTAWTLLPLWLCCRVTEIDFVVYESLFLLNIIPDKQQSP